MGRTLADLVATLAADPRHGAVVCDIDGTLAPIAPTPEQATVLPTALPELERLVVENDGLLPELGCRVEDKGVTFTVHYRGSPRPDHALRYLEAQIVPKLDRAGLAWSFGRMVLEVRPPVAIDKGSAVRRLRGRKRITNLMYVGDDRTDLDAFREATIRIAVRSAEGPPELIEQADACVDGPEQVVELLASL